MLITVVLIAGVEDNCFVPRTPKCNEVTFNYRGSEK